MHGHGSGSARFGVTGIQADCGKSVSGYGRMFDSRRRSPDYPLWRLAKFLLRHSERLFRITAWCGGPFFVVKGIIMAIGTVKWRRKISSWLAKVAFVMWKAA
jgi:hypothetical protein